MDATVVAETVKAVVFQLGGWGLLVLTLFGILGKIWVDRAIQQERTRNDQKLIEVESKLRREDNSHLAKLQPEIDLLKDKESRLHNDKLAIYRELSKLIVSLIVDIEFNNDPKKNLQQHEQRRLEIFAYMAMVAPQSVLTKYFKLEEHLFEVMGTKRKFSFSEMRALALNLLNEIRIDVGLDKSPVTYDGKY